MNVERMKFIDVANLVYWNLKNKPLVPLEIKNYKTSHSKKSI